MASLARSVVSLRVMGDELQPSEVTRLLGAEPRLAYAKGDELTSKHGRPRIARSGMWSIDGNESSPADLDVQIMDLLNRVTQDLAVWRLLRERFRMDLFFGWFMDVTNEGTSISSATLTAVGERGIDLSFDIYGGDPPE